MGNSPTNNLPTPNFAFEPPFPCRAGLRPFREAGYRLEAERPASHPDKVIVHNYGHGGAGITLSWGCASKVRQLVHDYLSLADGKGIAVLGSGVMGLTAATRLLEFGLPIRIYAKDMWAQTTSFVAGGEWGPSVVNYTDEAEFARILATSYRAFKASIGESFGVSERPYYSPVPSEALEKVRYLLPGLLPERQVLERLPFENYAQGGYLYRTLLIEPPIFLSRLRRDLHARGVEFITRIFTSGRKVLDGLDENIIINCTGLGSRVLWQDKSLGPIKGQLALLPAQPGLEFLFSQSGYLFPRADAVIIGGTFEEGIEDPTPDPGRCQELVDHMANVLRGGPVVPVLPDHIHHPASRPKLAPKLV